MANKVPLAYADVELQLSAAISVGDTTLSLSTAIDDDGIALPAGKYCFTIDNGSTQKEYLLGQLNGTAVTSVVSVSRQGVESTGAARAHRVGAPAIVSDFATIQRVADILRGQETVDGDNPISYDAEPTLTDRKEIATVAYVLDNVTGGTVAFDSQIVTGVNAGETVAAGKLVYFKTSDQEFYLADASVAAEVNGVQMGIALGAGTDGATITGGVQISGSYTTTGLTAGSTYYATDVAGVIGTSAGTTNRVIGLALSTTELLMVPVNPESPTSDMRDAMEGGGDFGAPSSSNKFATEDFFPVQFAVENANNLASLEKAVGSLSPTYAKTSFNKQLPFFTSIEVDGGWIIEETGDDIQFVVDGSQALFTSAGLCSMRLNFDDLRLASGQMNFSSTTEKMSLDWFASLPTSGLTGDIIMGISPNSANSYRSDYDISTYSRAVFALSQEGVLYAVVSKAGVGYTATDVSAGITIDDFNNFRIDFDFGTDAKFYINGTLVHTDSKTTNFPDGDYGVGFGFGRVSIGEMLIMAPNLSLEL